MDVDPVDRGHLKDATGFSPPIGRFGPPEELSGLVRRFWVPVWSLPPGEVSVQRVLQYPVCQVVVAPDYARLVGPRVGMSRQELAGVGWAFGTMLQPAAGALLAGGPMRGMVDRDLDLADVGCLDGVALAASVRAVLQDDPADRAAQATAAGLLHDALATLLPVDAEGELANAVVAHVEHDPTVLRVGDIQDRFGLGERRLQRLCARRIGLHPKFLIQRRRLHEAAVRLADPDRPGLAELAVELGYADQAHFHRDFQLVTGLTPSQYAGEPRSS